MKHFAPDTDRLRAREWNNPLRNFTLTRAIQLAESFPRGEFADLMWTLGAPYNGIETADGDLLAIISRRTSALMEMDWNAKAETGDKIDETLADEQAAAVEELMNGIDNLYEAIDHLAIAFVRGFSHCEIITGRDGIITELRPVDQWHVVRDGIYGGWKYNPDALQTAYRSLPEANVMPLDRFVIREVRRPAGRVALMKFVRANLSETDWGAFVEQYGSKNGVVTMPPDVAPEDEASYLALAQAVAQGGSGAMPHGSTYSPNSGDKGSGAGPFSDHLDYWTKKLVLVGTNGKLTMLTESGSGTLAGSAHSDAFDSLSRADARAISELITKQVVNPYIAKKFPGQPSLAYWELAFREEVDGSEVIADAAKLNSAGYRMDPAQLEEKSGYILTAPEADPGKDGETPAKAMQMHANALEAEKGVTTADGPEMLKKGDISPELRNRGSLSSGEAKEPSSRVAKPVQMRELAEMVAGALNGSLDAWVDVIAEAMAEEPESGNEEEEDE